MGPLIPPGLPRDGTSGTDNTCSKKGTESSIQGSWQRLWGRKTGGGAGGGVVRPQPKLPGPVTHTLGSPLEVTVRVEEGQLGSLRPPSHVLS